MPLFLSVLFTLLTFANITPDTDQPNQHRLVLSFVSDGFVPSEQQLAVAEGLNMTLFEVSEPSQVSSFSDRQYSYLLAIGPEFQVPGQLSHNLSAVADDMLRTYRDFERIIPGKIAAVGAMRYPFESYPNFIETAEALSDTLLTEITVPLYLQSAGYPVNNRPYGFNFTSVRAHPEQSQHIDRSVVHFVPSDDLNATFSSLNQTMDYLLNYDESILILPASWFFSQLERQSDLRYLFTDHMSGNSVVLPLPSEESQPPYFNWSIVLLFLIWGSFALHFRYQPIYGQSVIRYFSNHSFFVDDVMEHRLRNVLPGIVLLMQHALLTGLFVYASMEVMVTKLGLEVLNFHFPGIMLFANPLFSLFMAGVATALLLQAISALWIYFSNKELTAFSQVLNLYSWPLHLNLLVVTFLIVFNQMGFSEILILVLAGLFIIIWFFSFNIAAIDSTKLLETTGAKILFLSLTVGLHIVLLLGVLTYFLYTPSVIEPILFAIDVP